MEFNFLLYNLKVHKIEKVSQIVLVAFRYTFVDDLGCFAGIYGIITVILWRMAVH